MAVHLDRRRFLGKLGAFGALGWTSLGVLPLGQTTSGCDGGGGGPTTTLGPLEPVLLGVHPAASLQATDWGRRLQCLEVFDGRVFAGYGDWGANTGPIEMVGWDVALGDWVAEGSLDTECAWNLRRLGDRLVVPFIDPRGNTGDVAVRGAGSGAWTSLAVGAGTAGTLHCLDAATLDGTDLWICGARRTGRDGVVWRSPSGTGGDWEESLTIPSTSWYTRCSVLVAHEGGLFVAGYRFDPSPPNTVETVEGRRFDGTSWTDAPAFTLDVDAGVHRSGHRPLSVVGGVARRRATPQTVDPFEVLWFDGASLVAGPESVVDLTVDERGWLWWLDGDGGIGARLVWGGEPVAVATAPPGASCLAVTGGEIYVGTTASELYRMAR